MPKYWVKNYFAHGSFPEVGQKQKTEKKKKRKTEKLFRTWEIPRSGSKAEDGGEEEREKD